MKTTSYLLTSEGHVVRFEARFSLWCLDPIEYSLRCGIVNPTYLQYVYKYETAYC